MATTNLSDHNKEHVPSGAAMRVGICVAEWNEEITNGLYNGALETLLANGVMQNHITTLKVPGSFELPSGAQLLLEHQNVDAVICLGSVIQGETKHFDFVCQTCANGVKDVALKYNKPVIFGVLTDNNIDQARARSGGSLGNKGVEAAVTALKMVALQKSLKGNPPG